ncbi:MAG TPA: hypothetical protein VJB65_00165, partial [Patescibacteria group bacterium]|nr:hypothetical protein [Patescibacteria group bacterium]
RRVVGRRSGLLLQKRGKPLKKSSSPRARGKREQVHRKRGKTSICTLTLSGPFFILRAAKQVHLLGFWTNMLELVYTMSKITHFFYYGTSI